MTLKRKMRGLMLILQTFAIFALTLNNALITKANEINVEQPKTTMQSYVESMQPGWNLGNTFDATGGDETAWGNPVVTKELIDAIAAYGFKSIRIPVTWNHRLGNAPEYKIDSAFLEKIKQVIDWSIDAGMLVMLNMHHDTSWLMKMETQHDQTLEKYKAIWTQLSEYFGDYSERLMFEGSNEPRFSEDWAEDKEIYFTMLDTLNTEFYNIVRNSSKENNKQRPLVLPTVTCSPTQARIDRLAETISQLNDSYIIATVHYYGYWPFSVNIAGETTFGEKSISDTSSAFDRVYKTFVEKGIPVVIGEYGLLGFDKATEVITHSELLKYFAYVGSYAQEKGISVMLWDNGQHLDRETLKWRDETMFETIIKSVQFKVAQAETEYIYVKANEEITDVTVGIDYQDDEIISIKGETSLSEGIDCVYADDRIGISKSYIEKVLKKDFNASAQIKIDFRKSPDWSIYICYYDTPVLKESVRVGKNFEIATEFNGNKLTTMEAKYRNGQGAGNQDWTTFKEFNTDFYPNYTSSKIVLTDAFLRSLNNAEVTLTMHFLSGESVDYYLNKKDGNVLGERTKEALSQIEVPVTDNSKKSIASMPKGTNSEEQEVIDSKQTSKEESLQTVNSKQSQTDAPLNIENEADSSGWLTGRRVFAIILIVIIGTGTAFTFARIIKRLQKK